MKRMFCLLLILCPAWSVAASADQEADMQLQNEIGAFEITAEQRERAAANGAGCPVPDAGRGNPNRINTLPNLKANPPWIGPRDAGRTVIVCS